MITPAMARRAGWRNDGQSGWWELPPRRCGSEANVRETAGGAWEYWYDSGGWTEWGLADSFDGAIAACHLGLGLEVPADG